MTTGSDVRRTAAVAAAITAAACAALAFKVWGATALENPFTLDDPYIVLAMVEAFDHGTYGIDPSETTTPASSILFPFWVWLGARVVDPRWFILATNLLAACATAWEGAAMLRERAFPDRAAIALGAFAGICAVPVAFTGLEHSLHTWLTLAAFRQLIRLIHDDRPEPARLVALAVALPLVRYEGLALSGMILLVLTGRRQLAAAGALAAGVLAGCGSFTAWMLSRGLGALPSSIMVKTGLSQDYAAGSLTETLWGRLSANAAEAIDRPDQSSLLALIVLLAIDRGLSWRERRERADLEVALTCAAITVAHLSVGHLWWFGRYSVYLSALLICAVWARWSVPTQTSRWVTTALLGLATLNAGLTYVFVAMWTPTVARSVAGQHGVMRQIAARVDGPVAVNDIGWVSWKNERYVLDLWGLSRADIRDARLAHAPGWLTRETAAHDVGLVMIYKDWFAEDAEVGQWVHLGALTRTWEDPVIQPRVDLYATSPERAPALRAALQDVAATVPVGVVLTVDAAP
jgi:hypothetical protein